jgi:hypothetical protein
MFGALLSLIPIVGTLANGITSYLQTRNEVKITKDKNDLREIELRLQYQRKDLRAQLQQDIILFPFAFYMMLYIWNHICGTMYPDLIWPVKELDMYLILTGLAAIIGVPIRDKFMK